MAIQRQIDPLPPGCYWVDVFSKDFDTFRAWLLENTGKVRVIKTESFPMSGMMGTPARDWYLFDVLEPVKWEGPGFPDFAKSKELTSEDTADRPPPPKDPIEKLEDVLEIPAKVGGTILFGGAAAVAVYFLLQAASKTGKGKGKRK